MVRLPSAGLTDILGSDEGEISLLPANQRQMTTTDASFCTPHSSDTCEALIADTDWGGRTILVLTTTNTDLRQPRDISLYVQGIPTLTTYRKTTEKCITVQYDILAFLPRTDRWAVSVSKPTLLVALQM